MHRLSCSAACGILPDQSSNPCPLHWQLNSFFLNFLICFIYLLFLAALGLRCCAWALPSCGELGAAPRRGARASHCGGLSPCGARAPGVLASAAVARRLSSCGSRAPECRLSSCGALAQLPCSMWDLSGPGLEPASPALAGGLPTTAPPGKLCQADS